MVVVVVEYTGRANVCFDVNGLKDGAAGGLISDAQRKADVIERKYP